MSRSYFRGMTKEQRTFEQAALTPSAWCPHGNPPAEVWERITRLYIRPLRAFGLAHGLWLVPSDRSCYRSPEHERARGRNGRSLHCFPPATGGACDLRPVSGGWDADRIELVKSALPFRRIAYYPANGFLHVDYRTGRVDRSWFTCASPVAEWVFRQRLPPLILAE